MKDGKIGYKYMDGITFTDWYGYRTIFSNLQTSTYKLDAQGNAKLI